MSEFMGREYNYHTWTPSVGAFNALKEMSHAGDMAPDFTLPDLEGKQLRLSDLKGKPIVIEFGAIT